jgi:hypothetical protein
VAFINGKHQGSSVTRALARHKLEPAAQAVGSDGGHEMGDGQEITIKRNGNSFHTTATKHDGTTDEADHGTFDEAMEHAGSHLGAKTQPKMREKNRHRKDKEPEHQDALEQAAGTETKGSNVSLGDMGVADGSDGD